MTKRDLLLTALDFFLSSGDIFPLSSSSPSAPPSLSSSSSSSSSSLSGAPKALTGFEGAVTAFPGAAKLDSFGPEPPANPLPIAEPNALPLPRAPNPEVDDPDPNAKVAPGFISPEPRTPVVVVVVLDCFALARPPNPDGAVCPPPPKTLGFEAPIVPNGEVAEADRAPKPEFMKVEEDCGLSLRVLPNTCFAAVDVSFEVSDSADTFLESDGLVADISCAAIH